MKIYCSLLVLYAAMKDLKTLKKRISYQLVKDHIYHADHQRSRKRNQFFVEADTH